MLLLYTNLPRVIFRVGSETVFFIVRIFKLRNCRYFGVTKLSLDSYFNAVRRHHRFLNLWSAHILDQTFLNTFKEKGNSLTSSDTGGTKSILLVVQPERKKKFFKLQFFFIMLRKISNWKKWVLAWVNFKNVNYLILWTRCALMRAPEAPRGWPSAMAPPQVLSLSMLMTPYSPHITTLI